MDGNLLRTSTILIVAIQKKYKPLQMQRSSGQIYDVHMVKAYMVD